MLLGYYVRKPADSTVAECLLLETKLRELNLNQQGLEQSHSLQEESTVLIKTVFGGCTQNEYDGSYKHYDNAIKDASEKTANGEYNGNLLGDRNNCSETRILLEEEESNHKEGAEHEEDDSIMLFSPLHLQPLSRINNMKKSNYFSMMENEQLQSPQQDGDRTNIDLSLLDISCIDHGIEHSPRLSGHKVDLSSFHEQETGKNSLSLDREFGSEICRNGSDPVILEDPTNVEESIVDNMKSSLSAHSFSYSSSVSSSSSCRFLAHSKPLDFLTKAGDRCEISEKDAPNLAFDSSSLICPRDKELSLMGWTGLSLSDPHRIITYTDSVRDDLTLYPATLKSLLASTKCHVPPLSSSLPQSLQGRILIITSRSNVDLWASPLRGARKELAQASLQVCLHLEVILDKLHNLISMYNMYNNYQPHFLFPLLFVLHTNRFTRSHLAFEGKLELPN